MPCHYVNWRGKGLNNRLISIQFLLLLLLGHTFYQDGNVQCVLFKWFIIIGYIIFSSKSQVINICQKCFFYILKMSQPFWMTFPPMLQIQRMFLQAKEKYQSLHWVRARREKRDDTGRLNECKMTLIFSIIAGMKLNFRNRGIDKIIPRFGNHGYTNWKITFEKLTNCGYDAQISVPFLRANYVLFCFFVTS